MNTNDYRVKVKNKPVDSVQLPVYSQMVWWTIANLVRWFFPFKCPFIWMNYHGPVTSWRHWNDGLHMGNHPHSPIAGLISSSDRFSSRISQRPAGDDTGGCLTVLDSEVFVPQLLFAGVFIQAEQIPIWLRWLQYTCALKYGHLSLRREKMIWRGYAGSGK